VDDAPSQGSDTGPPRASGRCSSGAMVTFAAADLDGLVRIKRKLKKIQYRHT
jgi:hypothetical protein